MDEHIYIALIAALVNLILSILVPCALKDRKNIFPQIRMMLEQHRATLLSSSILVAVIVYISLKAAPVVKAELIPESVLNLAQLSR